MITREQARDIATQFLRERNKHGFTVDKVYWWDEIPYRKPSVHGLNYEKSKCWVAYLRDPDPGLMLKSSDVIVVSMDFGQVLCFGSANDEG